MCFVDNCPIYIPKDFNIHLQHVEAVFQSLEKANLSLKLTKCKFGFWKVELYGHFVSNTGFKMAPSQNLSDFFRNFIQKEVDADNFEMKPV